MLDLGGSLKRTLTRAYLAGSTELTSRMLAGRSGLRVFDRVVVVAALGRNNGITRGARLQAEALRAVGIETELLDATLAIRHPLFRARHRPGTAYIIHNDGSQTANLIGSLLPHASSAYRIAYWAWELADPPADWAGCDRTVHEIWTPSSFSRDSLARLTRRPIHVVPHSIATKPARQRTPGEPFTVLTMADTRSSLSRKNPAGSVDAFRRAFGTSSSARLLLKLSGRTADIAAFEAASGHALHADNIQIIRAHLDEADLASLYRSADVLLSLHRAEGFGLPMLDAMSHGVPAIATGWSGNLEFMNAENSLLVPYRLVPVVDASDIYRHGSWAEPDLDAAAEALRALAGNPDLHARYAAAAHRAAAAVTPNFPIDIPNRRTWPEASAA